VGVKYSSSHYYLDADPFAFEVQAATRRPQLPKRISSKELAKLLKIKKSALSEHLRKAEKRILDSTLVG